MNDPTDALHEQSLPDSGSTERLDEGAVDGHLARLDGWQRDGDTLVRRYEFRNWLETLAFVGAAGWVAHRADHHPDLEVSYKACVVRYTTHSAGGLTISDFICAARLDRLVADS